MPSPTLSILIPYFNEGELFREGLRSLLEQKYPPEEVLVYDDASTKWPNNFLVEGLPIKIFRGEKNRGPSFGRNFLLEKSGCDYIHYHDADDLFCIDWSTRVRAEIENSAPDAVFTEVSALVGERRIPEGIVGFSRLHTDPDLIRFSLESFLLPTVGTYKKSFIRKIGGYSEKLWQAEDFYFHAHLASFQPVYKWIDEPLVIHRVRSESRSEKTGEVLSSHLQALEMLAHELPGKYLAQIAEEAAHVGSRFYRLGDLESAKKAFDFSDQLGGAEFRAQNRIYRLLAKTCGPLSAEKVGHIYRTCIPEFIRKAF